MEDVPIEWMRTAENAWNTTHATGRTGACMRAAIAAVAPLIAKAERERIAKKIDGARALSSDPNNIIAFNTLAAAIRARVETLERACQSALISLENAHPHYPYNDEWVARHDAAIATARAALSPATEGAPKP